MSAKIERHEIDLEISGFLLDREAAKVAPGTLDYYRRELSQFRNWLTADQPEVRTVIAITPPVLRMWMIALGHRRKKLGGLDANYRALSAFFHWWVEENDLDPKANPLRKVTRPGSGRDPLDAIPGATEEDVRALLAACAQTQNPERNRAIVLLFYDSGLRLAELCALNIGDITLATGVAFVAHGKGDKPRDVFFGAKVRRALVAYLKTRELNPAAPLFLNRYGKRLRSGGVADVIETLGQKAGLTDIPSAHDLRRGFTATSIANGADEVSVARQLGHRDTKLVGVYNHQRQPDLINVHARTSPVDSAKLR